MWVCGFTFTPMVFTRFNVVIKEVAITSVTAKDEGILVECPVVREFCPTELYGYIGKLTSSDNTRWIGFFFTEEEAKSAFNRLMLDWWDVIESKMFG